jgi:hypothetical protein
MRNFGKVSVALFVSLSFAVGVAWAASGAGWSITLNTPAAGTKYAVGANIGTYRRYDRLNRNVLYDRWC